MIRSLFRQRLQSFRRNWTLQFSTLVVVTACYSVISLSLLMSQNLQKILTVWGEDLQMTVYLAEDTTPQEVEALQKRLETSRHVGKVSFVSKEKALQEFRGQMASYAPDVLNESDLLTLIPASFQVSLGDTMAAFNHLKILDELATTLRNEKSVAEVSYGQDWVKKYSQFLYYFQRACQALGVVILCAALFVLSNVIRASVQSRHQEIEVLELIGATPSMIRRPFLLEGAVIGFLSSGFAIGVCYFFFGVILRLFQNELGFLQLAPHLHFLTSTVIFGFCGTGTALGAIGSYMCVRQINDGWAALGT